MLSNAAPDALDVWWGHRLVGRVTRGERLAFRYDAAWLDERGAWPISVALPLQVAPHEGATAAAFFANLLPEGAARQRVAAKLGISEGNDFELLRAIGGECAGALVLLEPGEEPREGPGEYERISERELDRIAEPGALVPLLVGGKTTRLSLAGAQDKLPVLVDETGMWLPLHGSPSTHILKVGNPTYRHLPENEALVTWFAEELLGAPGEIVEVELLSRRKGSLLLVRRYDRRVVGEPWEIERLHQEDMCQALGVIPSRKYEKEGGPGLAQCLALVRDHTSAPLLETRRLLRWAIFNLLAGNSDGHAKNLSFLYPGPTLAPRYDLVCTRCYPHLERDLAMQVGGEADPGQIAKKHVIAAAEELSIGKQWLLGLVAEMLDAAAPALDRAIARFRDRHGDHAVLKLVPPVIRKQLKRTRQLFMAT